MRPISTAVAATALGLMLSACGQRSAGPPRQSSQQRAVAAGAKLYKQHCQSCHGSDLKGGKPIGSATSADIRWSGLKNGYTTAKLVRAILQGRDETDSALDPAMPRWHGQLTKAQVNDLVAYLKTK